MQNDVKQVDRDAVENFYNSSILGYVGITRLERILAAHRKAAESAKDAEITSLQARVVELEEQVGRFMQISMESKPLDAKFANAIFDNVEGLYEQ